MRRRKSCAAAYNNLFAATHRHQPWPPRVPQTHAAPPTAPGRKGSAEGQPECATQRRVRCSQSRAHSPSAGMQAPASTRPASTRPPSCPAEDPTRTQTCDRPHVSAQSWTGACRQLACGVSTRARVPAPRRQARVAIPNPAALLGRAAATATRPVALSRGAPQAQLTSASQDTAMLPASAACPHLPTRHHADRRGHHQPLPA